MIVTLIPFAIFLLACLAIAYNARPNKKSGFVKEYFIGNRFAGGFVLAMTCIATYGSVSSFVGGPGQAYTIGFGWVYMSAVQVTSLFLLYGLVGKKLAVISRRINAITIIDIIRARYKSNILANLSAVIILCFFIAMMIAQFVGGAKLFEAVTGLNYVTGLALFGLVSIVFTSIGGFRGVALTDTLCGIAMLVCIFVLGYGLFSSAGDFDQIVSDLKISNPEIFEITSSGNMPIGLYITQWLLVGVLTFALPQSVVRTLGFKDEKALKKAMVIGTIIIGIMMIAVTSLGVFAHGILKGTVADYGRSVDNIIPAAIVQSLPTWLIGIAVIGPLAASISTVSSLLIMTSSSIVKDVLLSCKKRPVLNNIPKVSQLITFCIGLIVVILSITPPDVIWKINMFAFGGLESAFAWVLIAGLFWRRANKYGAVLSMLLGVGVYCTLMALGINVFGMHQIIAGIIASLIGMIVGSFIGKKNEPDEVFFPA